MPCIRFQLPRIFAGIMDELANISVAFTLNDIHQILYTRIYASGAILLGIHLAQVAHSKSRIVCEDFHATRGCLWGLEVQSIFNILT